MTPARSKDHDGVVTDDREAILRKALDDGTMAFPDLVRLKYWRTLPGKRNRVSRELGKQYYDRGLQTFERQHGGTHARVVIFAEIGTGVYVLPNGEFEWAVIGSAIDYDWSAAHQLLNRVKAAYDQAHEWWGPAHAGGAATASHRQQWRDRARAAQLRPHVERAYDQATAIFSAVHCESLERRRMQTPAEAAPSGRYDANLAVLRSQAVAMETLLGAAAQRKAQQSYGRGMLWGMVALLGLCSAIAAAFWLSDLPAWYGVAFPAGALGALVSVLQRMTSGSLRLDVHSGSDMLATYGAVRPLVGAILGMVAFVLIAGELLPWVTVSDAPLAFYTGIGFLAGFNERFAQDMLAGSADRLDTLRKSSLSIEAVPLVD